MIHRHTDAFDLYRWARQALGGRGVVLGWAPPVHRAIRRQASRSLEAFAHRIAGDGTAWLLLPPLNFEAVDPPP